MFGDNMPASHGPQSAQTGELQENSIFSAGIFESKNLKVSNSLVMDSNSTNTNPHTSQHPSVWPSSRGNPASRDETTKIQMRMNRGKFVTNLDQETERHQQQNIQSNHKVANADAIWKDPHDDIANRSRELLKGSDRKAIQRQMVNSSGGNVITEQSCDDKFENGPVFKVNSARGYHDMTTI